MQDLQNDKKTSQLIKAVVTHFLTLLLKSNLQVDCYYSSLNIKFDYMYKNMSDIHGHCYLKAIYRWIRIQSIDYGGERVVGVLILL